MDRKAFFGSPQDYAAGAYDAFRTVSTGNSGKRTQDVVPSKGPIPEKESSHLPNALVGSYIAYASFGEVAPHAVLQM
jgi:hypothetical protein